MLSTVREITDALFAPSPCPLPRGAREHRTVISRTVLRKPTRFVKELTAEDREILRHLRDEGQTRRIRQRAHAVLLSEKGHSVNQLAATFEVARDTVRDWLDNWERNGVEGLDDKPRTGKPPTLTPEEQEKAVELLNDNPRSIEFVLQEIERLMNKKISANTLRRIARRAHLHRKRNPSGHVRQSCRVGVG